MRSSFLTYTRFTNAAVLLLLGCGSTKPDSAYPRVIVYGRVITELGTAVANAAVKVANYPTGCSGERTVVYDIATGADGRYRIDFVVPASVGCVKVVVQPGQGTSLKADSVSLGTLPFRTVAPYDSVASNLTLKAP